VHSDVKSLLRKAIVFIAACAVFTPAIAQFGSKNETSVVTTPQVRAELLAHAPQGVGPGQTVLLGLQLTHQPEWHTYWKNSGDSGLPTTLQWTLPAGVTAGDIQWPVPKKIPIGNLANYGYENTVLLPVPLTVSPDFKPGLLSSDLEVKLRAAWLVCKQECIPEEGEFTLKVPVKSSTAAQGAAFDAALAANPKPHAGAHTVAVAGEAIEVSVAGLPAAWRGQTLEFYPETSGVIETAAKWTQAWAGDTWTAKVPLSAQRSASPTVMPVVLAAGEGAARQGLRAELPLQGQWPAIAPIPPLSPALDAALKENASNSGAAPAGNTPASGQKPLNNLTLWTALLGALLGGLILNLMPCVFPVLAIKVLSFTQHANDRAAHRVSGVAYTAGVVLSFAALGALMLALRAGGEALGWGFQLQSPWVVAGLAILFTVIGLNLSGLFEFGQFAPSGLAALQAKSPALNSLLSGVLAVAVASPCTAPFMGASLGFAIDLPAAQALLVFAFIGLGMALPFLAAAFIPAVAQALPRPGAWMDSFKKFMAFPMYATVAWLVWVLGHLSGIDGAAALLALLVALAALIWALGLAGRSRTVAATLSIAACAGLVWAIGPFIVKNTAPEPVSAAAGERWQAWAPGKVDQVLAQGRPVFVDYTAAWCVTCQYNKKTVLTDPAVLAAFDAKNVQLLRADWTRRDPAISASLSALGRNGVPVYVLQAPGRAPVVLSEILSVGDIQAAIEKL
jgi:thiol:disulfide interchange protein